jgi:hypothetical protein
MAETKEEVPRRLLGRTGEKVSAIGLGVYSECNGGGDRNRTFFRPFHVKEWPFPKANRPLSLSTPPLLASTPLSIVLDTVKVRRERPSGLEITQ